VQAFRGSANASAAAPEEPLEALPPDVRAEAPARALRLKEDEKRWNLIQAGHADTYAASMNFGKIDGGAGLFLKMDFLDQEYPWYNACFVLAMTLLYITAHGVINGRQSGQAFEDSEAFDNFRMKATRNAMVIGNEGKGLGLLLTFRSLQDEQRYVMMSNHGLFRKAAWAFLVALPYTIFEFLALDTLGRHTMAPIYLALLALCSIAFAAMGVCPCTNIAPYREHVIAIGFLFQLLLLVGIKLGQSTIESSLHSSMGPFESRKCVLI